MNDTTPPVDHAPKWIRLVARIWSSPIILITFFIAIGNFWSWLTNGVADPYAVEDITFIESLPPALIFISAIGLALAWRWELFGGIFSLVFIAGDIIVLIIQRTPSADLARDIVPYLISLFVLVPGILFLIYGLRTKKSG